MRCAVQAIVWCNQLVVLLARTLRSLPLAAGARCDALSGTVTDEQDRLRLTVTHLQRHLHGSDPIATPTAQ